MGAPVLGVPWPELRSLAEQGVPIQTIADRFQPVTVAAIRKRSERERWLLPTRLIKRLENMNETRRLASSGAVSSSSVASSLSTCDTKNLSHDMVIDTWQQKGEQVRSLAWEIGKRSLASVQQSGVPITSIGEVAKAVDMMRKATGQFEDTPALSLSIFGGSATEDLEESPVYDLVATDNDTDWM